MQRELAQPPTNGAGGRARRTALLLITFGAAITVVVALWQGRGEAPPYEGSAARTAHSAAPKHSVKLAAVALEEGAPGAASAREAALGGAPVNSWINVIVRTSPGGLPIEGAPLAD